MQRVHHRSYDVEVYRERAGLLRLRGRLRDEKPAGLHFDGDTDPIVIHDIVVDLFVELPSTVVTDVDVVFETHPHIDCPRITEHYGELVGVAIGRGFSRRVRELFGGPRGCSHTTALLQAMAPVIVQSVWSMRVLDEREEPVDFVRDPPTAEERRQRWIGTVDTCHVWAADGEHVAALEAGGTLTPPIAFTERAERLGVAPDEWLPQFER